MTTMLINIEEVVMDLTAVPHLDVCLVGLGRKLGDSQM